MGVQMLRVRRRLVEDIVRSMTKEAIISPAIADVDTNRRKVSLEWGGPRLSSAIRKSCFRRRDEESSPPEIDRLCHACTFR